jgi:hypothetical protein
MRESGMARRGPAARAATVSVQEDQDWKEF